MINTQLPGQLARERAPCARLGDVSDQCVNVVRLHVKKLIAGALVAAALVAGPAAAATIDINPQNPSNVFKDATGKNGWYVVSSLMAGTTTLKNIGAGALRVKADEGNGTMNFIAFCLSPTTWLNLDKDYKAGSNLSASVRGLLGALYANAFDSVTDSVSAGAFQMAVWEIVTETAREFDVNAGYFRMTGNGAASNKAEVMANGWLANLNSGAWSSVLGNTRYYSAETPGSTQDLVTNGATDGATEGATDGVAAVPVPAAGLLLVAALGGLVLVRRRAA